LSPPALLRWRALGALAAALLLGAAVGSCRRALTNPADPGSPTYPGEPVTIDPGPDLAGSIGDTLLFQGFFLGDTSRVSLYTWDFDGDGEDDWQGHEAVAVPHAYRAVGAYEARFTVWGVVGDRGSAKTLATITDEAPIGGIGSDTLVVPGDQVSVVPRVRDDGRIVRYEWDFDGDGSVDSVETSGGPVFLSFPDLGDHLVSLRVVDDDGHVSSFGRRFRACPLPTVPASLSLPDSAADTPVRLVLSWESQSGCGDPLTYDVYLNPIDDPEKLVAGDLAVPAYHTGTLFHYSTYHWRVVVRDAGGREQSTGDLTFFTRGVPYAMVFIEPGTVPIGSTFSPDESPVHATYIDGYYMDQRETTRYEFTAFLNATGYVPEGSFNGSYPIGEEDFPVSGVSWNDAAAYAAWRGKRLPTEAEWEYSARGPVERVFPWGSRIVPNTCSYANVASLPGVECVGAAVQTQSYPLGRSWKDVWDMSGNVAEWVADWYDPNYYSDPFAAVLPTGPATGTTKVIRGGSWRAYRLEYSVTRRAAAVPTAFSDEIGFRCVISIDAPMPTPPPP
jgi:formylglycine-generating enzyme required for sulfatase activity